MIKSVYKQVRGFAFTYPCPRKLREVMKISLVEREMPHTIKDIWSEYHKPRSENIAATLSKTEYETLRKKFSLLTFLNISALESPMYLVPIKRKGGHFMLLGQNQAKTFV